MVLEVWDRVEAGDPRHAGVAALAVAMPEMPATELADLPLGTRDNLLLRLREQTLGSTLNGRASCPECSVNADFALDVHDFTDFDADGSAQPDQRDFLLEEDGASVHFRLPTGADLALAAESYSVKAARDVLLQRCILGAVVDGTDCAPDELPPDLLDRLSQRIEDLDPMAELPLALQCANCGNDWEPLLEIGSFLWAELSELAERLMNDVHTLARSYGWPERDILAMSSARRKFYIELVG